MTRCCVTMSGYLLMFGDGAFVEDVVNMLTMVVETAIMTMINKTKQKNK